MRLTPLDIRKQEFSRGMRGFNPEEVQAFLQMLSNQWQEIIDEQRHLEEKLSTLQGKLAHYEKVEEALQEALQTARESSQRTLENADQKARLVLQEAEVRAEQIQQRAEQKRQQMRGEMMQLLSRNQEIVVRLRAFLTSELELLGRYEREEAAGFARPLHGEEAPSRPAPSSSPSESAGIGGEEVAPPPTPPVPAGDAQLHDVEAPAQALRPPVREERPAAPKREPAEVAPSVPGSAGEGPSAALEQDLPAEQVPTREEGRPGPGWVVRPVFSGPPSSRREAGGLAATGDAPAAEQENADEEATTPSEEIEKIRRILKDLD